MPVIYLIKKENGGHVMPCFFTGIRALILAPKMRAVLAGVKNEPLRPNLARESSRMQRKFFKYLSSLYLRRILLKKRIQGTLRPIFYPLIPAGRARHRDWAPPECAPCSLVQKMSHSSLPFQDTALGHDENYLYMYLGYAGN